MMSEAGWIHVGTDRFLRSIIATLAITNMVRNPKPMSRYGKRFGPPSGEDRGLGVAVGAGVGAVVGTVFGAVVGVIVGVGVGGIPVTGIFTSNPGDRGNSITATEPSVSTARLASGIPYKS